MKQSDYSRLKCSRCGSTDLQKVMSRFSCLRSEESRLESLADPSTFSDIDEKDPRSIARWMKKMGKQLGDEVGEDFDKLVDEAAEEAEKETMRREKEGSEEDLSDID
jgi:hypothetical protein